MKFSRLAVVAVLVLGGIGVVSGKARAVPVPSDVCALITPAEIQSATGIAAGSFTKQLTFCVANSPAGKIMLRAAERSDKTGAKESAGLAVAKKMGAKVDLRRDGPTTCMTSVPPPNLAAYGYNTTCTYFNKGLVVGIEFQVTSESLLVPIDKVKPLVLKMAGRAGNL